MGLFARPWRNNWAKRKKAENLRNRSKFLDNEEKRERDLILIDYENPTSHVYMVTEKGEEMITYILPRLTDPRGLRDGQLPSA